MKQKTGRKLLSFLLTLAMVLSLLPGMSLTAYAESGDETIPLTFEAKTDGVSVTLNNAKSGTQYNTDSMSDWADYTAGSTISLNEGEMVQFHGEGTDSDTQFSVTGECYVYGNVMSLLDKEEFSSAMSLPSKAFYQLFQGNGKLLNHSSHDLVLPATSLGRNCYERMFYGCTSLTRAPELPATTLAGSCYKSMFEGCTSLAAAPELPATTLEKECYYHMFTNCTSLTVAPELPATTLTDNCYQTMFKGCTGLTAAPELPATMLAKSCYSYMFEGCTSLTTAPELPAATLASYCYSNMFKDCTLLNEVTCLATDISAISATDNWLNGVGTTGTFTKAADMSDWTQDSVSGIPEGWTVKTYGETGAASNVIFGKVTDVSQITTENISTCTLAEAKAWIIENWDNVFEGVDQNRWNGFAYMDGAVLCWFSFQLSSFDKNSFGNECNPTGTNIDSLSGFFNDANGIVYLCGFDDGSTPTTYTITVDNGIVNGTVTADPTSVAAGDTVTLTVTPDIGYQLKELNITSDMLGDLKEAIGSAVFTNSSNDTIKVKDDTVVLTNSYGTEYLSTKCWYDSENQKYKVTFNKQGDYTLNIDENNKIDSFSQGTYDTFSNLNGSDYTFSVRNVELSGTGNTRTFIMPASNVTVSATFEEVKDPVPYQKWDDERKKIVDAEACTDYTVVTNSTTAFENGKWYVVNADVSSTNRITVTGTVNLILCDGATLTASKGIAVEKDNSLTIYGQTNNTGKLIATGDGNAAIGGNKSGSQKLGSITINGGTIEATGGDSYAGAAIGGGYNPLSNIGCEGSITINGGIITAVGKVNAGIGFQTTGGTAPNITINGGTIYATGSTNGKGINGTITANVSIYGSDESMDSVTKMDSFDTLYKYMTTEKSHEHSFTYVVGTGDEANTITAACTDGCDITEGLTLTINEPSDLSYDGNAKAATLSTGYNTTAFPGEYTIKYYQGTTEVEATNVKAAGDYTAKVTVGDVTAGVDFTIAKAIPSIETIPTASAITYGQTLASSNLTGGVAKLGDATVEGTFTWKNIETKPAVSDSDTTEYDVVFTPTDENYSTANCKVKLTVNKADPTMTAPTAKTGLVYTGLAQELINAGSTNDGKIYYAVTTENTAPTDDSLYTTSIPSKTDAGTYYVWYKVVGDANHNNSEAACVTVKVAEPEAEAEDSDSEEDNDSEDDEDDYYVPTTISGDQYSALPVTNHTGNKMVVTTGVGEAKRAAGITGDEYLEVEIDSLQSDSPAMKLINEFAAQRGLTVLGCMDVNVYRVAASGARLGRVTDLQSPLELLFEVPEGVDGSQYDFGVIRVHDGAAELLKDTDNDRITVKILSDKFSAYAIVSGAKGSFVDTKATGSGSARVISKSGSKASPKTYDDSKFVPEVAEVALAEFTRRQTEQEVADLLITPQANRFPFAIVIVALLVMVAFIGGETVYFHRKKKN